jgi:hypothetical protein
VDFFTNNTFLISTLGAGAAARVLTDPFSQLVGDVCHGEATAMVTIACVLAEGGTCPGPSGT